MIKLVYICVWCLGTVSLVEHVFFCCFFSRECEFLNSTFDSDEEKKKQHKRDQK